MSDVLQGSPEWHALRVGKVTASRVADIVRQTKTGVSAMRANYMGDLIAERLTGVPSKSANTASMQWGTETEGEARAAYALVYDHDITQVAFVPHPTIAMAGASPDGLIGRDGLVEFKCPNTSTHIEAILGAKLDADHIKQAQWQMACTGRRWCDLVSFDPRLPAEYQFEVRRVVRDQVMIDELESAVVKFIDELEAKLDAIRATRRGKAAA